jgi:hypothetical protein
VHEEEAVRAFIVPHRRSRYASRLRRGGEIRAQFIREHFPHMRDLDRRFAERIEPPDQHLVAICGLLRARGAPAKCYVFGAHPLDAQTLGLEAALAEVVGSNSGTFVSCIPAKLAYFEGEETNERYVLSR